MEKLLDVEDVAAILDVHHNTVRRLCKARKIQFKRVGKLLRFRLEWIHDYVESR